MPARKPSTTPAATISIPPSRATSAGSRRSMRAVSAMGFAEANDRPIVPGRGQSRGRDPDRPWLQGPHRQSVGKRYRHSQHVMAPAPHEEREALMLTTFGVLSLLVG